MQNRSKHQVSYFKFNLFVLNINIVPKKVPTKIILNLPTLFGIKMIVTIVMQTKQATRQLIVVSLTFNKKKLL